MDPSPTASIRTRLLSRNSGTKEYGSRVNDKHCSTCVCRNRANYSSIDEEIDSSPECSVQASPQGQRDDGDGSDVGSRPDMSSSLSSECHSGHHHNEWCLRRKLRFYFMDPIEKYRARRKCPWKLIIQLFKIIIVTTQLVMFGTSRFGHVTFVEDNTTAFKHLFLARWDAAREPQTYPPSLGKFAIYVKNDFYYYLDFAIYNYENVMSQAIGSYDFTQPSGPHAAKFCKVHYKKGKIWPANSTLEYDSTIVTDCTTFNSRDYHQDGNFSSRYMLEKTNMSVNFDRLNSAQLQFSVKTVHLKSLRQLDTPDCYRFEITISFDNSMHSGQLGLDLTVQETKLTCRGSIEYKDDDETKQIISQLVNVTVLFVSGLSFVLCSRALYRAHLLKLEAVKFFRSRRGHKLSWSDKMEFVNFWYILIVFSDLAIIVGSALKMRIEQRSFDRYDVVAVFLGVGNWMVWIGVLRYLGFFKKYNILIMTMKKTFPKVFRFTLCALIIYVGYMIAGWIVLGPYHIKFRTLSGTSECLFSLTNGDDIFATFATMTDAHGQMLWYFHRVYMYSFTSLFILVILSLFVAVIIDTYDTIKECQTHGRFPQTPLGQFVSECRDAPGSGVYHKRHVGDEHDWTDWFYCCTGLCRMCWGALTDTLCTREPQQQQQQEQQEQQQQQQHHQQQQPTGESDDTRELPPTNSETSQLV